MSTSALRTLQKIILRLVRAILIALILVIGTTYGWKVTNSSPSNIPNQEVSSRLKEAVHVLSENIGIRNYAYFENLEKAASYIETSLKDIGYSVEAWSYDVDGQQFKNIVTRMKNNNTEEYILIGAHYDSCFNPGADDNASGIAGLLELARLLKKESLKTNIMFVAFTNEEPPFFQTDKMGSRVFVRTLQEKDIKIKAMIVLEMIGFYSEKEFSQKYLPLLGSFYPNKGNFIALVGNFKSKDLVDFIHKDFKKNRYFPMEAIVAPDFVPGINFSDHASFWEAGIPAVMITDTAYLRNQNYHSAGDTIEKLNFEKMARVVMGLKESIVNLANK